MLELVLEGGWLMLPILLGSIVALAIVLERLWALRADRVCPDHLIAEVWMWVKKGDMDEKKIETLRRSSPLGEVLAAGLVHAGEGREQMKEAIEDTGRHVVHELGRYLNTLGTVAAISPLLGLLGTVVGIMKVFAVISTQATANPQALSGGIAEALITTAAGLIVAIPSLILYRYFRGKVDEFVVRMEADAIRLVESVAKSKGRAGSGKGRAGSTSSSRKKTTRKKSTNAA